MDVQLSPAEIEKRITAAFGAKPFRVEDTEQSQEHRRDVVVARFATRKQADSWLNKRAKEQPDKVARGAYVVHGAGPKEEGL